MIIPSPTHRLVEFNDGTYGVLKTVYRQDYMRGVAPEETIVCRNSNIAVCKLWLKQNAPDEVKRYINQ